MSIFSPSLPLHTDSIVMRLFGLAKQLNLTQFRINSDSFGDNDVINSSNIAFLNGRFQGCLHLKALSISYQGLCQNNSNRNNWNYPLGPWPSLVCGVMEWGRGRVRDNETNTKGFNNFLSLSIKQSLQIYIHNNGYFHLTPLSLLPLSCLENRLKLPNENQVPKTPVSLQ